MKRALLDANLVVLLVVGEFDPGFIAVHKRTRICAPEDFETLRSYLDRFGRIETTPYCLAETSNLLSQVAEPIAKNLRQVLKVLLSEILEVYIPGAEAVESDCFVALGLTDAALAELANADQERTLVTVDLDLYLRSQRNQLEAVNFLHVRSGAWN